MGKLLLLHFVLLGIVVCINQADEASRAGMEPKNLLNSQLQTESSKTVDVDVESSPQSNRQEKLRQKSASPSISKKDQQSITYAIILVGILLVAIGIKRCLSSENLTNQVVPRYTQPSIIIEQAQSKVKAPYSPTDKKIIVQKFLVSSPADPLTDSIGQPIKRS